MGLGDRGEVAFDGMALRRRAISSAWAVSVEEERRLPALKKECEVGLVGLDGIGGFRVTDVAFRLRQIGRERLGARIVTRLSKGRN